MSELSELFDRDPLQLTDQDIDKIVAHMRASAVQFELGAKVPTAKTPKPTKSAKTQDLLKDLGLA